MANAPTSDILPSQETKNPWIYADAPDINIHIQRIVEETTDNSFEGESSCGKWMIFNDCVRVIPKLRMTYHDYAWQCIKKLVESNPSSVSGLHRAKCSTAWTDGYETKPGCTNGVICCYTLNYTDKHLAKRAADAIRKEYYYPRNILYKTDEDTYANKYGHLGNKYVSIYKHTVGNEMFERDSAHPRMWNIVSFES